MIKAQHIFYTLAGVLFLFAIFNFGNYFYFFGEGVYDDKVLLGFFLDNWPRASFYEVNIFLAATLTSILLCCCGIAISALKNVNNLPVLYGGNLAFFGIIAFNFWYNLSSIPVNHQPWYPRMIFDPIFSYHQGAIEYISIELNTYSFLGLLIALLAYLITTIVILSLYKNQYLYNKSPKSFH